MKFSLFYHSLESDWNHGNAHFLRGVVTELQQRGHQVRVFEPADGWSRKNLLREHGQRALQQFHERYPHLSSTLYDQQQLDLEEVVSDADVVIAHEWNEPWLINALGEMHDHSQGGSGASSSFTLLFHDTHHRMVSSPGSLKDLRLDRYDGILAFGDVLSDIYRQHGWSRFVWTWHEAADTKIFFPQKSKDEYPLGDLVWIGNWGDDERSTELEEFLFRPSDALHLRSTIYGVGYPEDVLSSLRQRGIRHGGWLPNFLVPELFANHKVTVHVPRRFYAETLPGIPTIRPFEALACGIPLITAPWQDTEDLFRNGQDYLVARNGEEMQQHLRRVLQDPPFAQDLAAHGLETIRKRHTCVHRVDQLLQILVGLRNQQEEKTPNVSLASQN